MTNVTQQRVLHTAIPGPRSIELQARKSVSVSAGVGTGLPVCVESAGGGILVDVDGNQLIDFGSGIAVTSVGNAAPRVVEPRVEAMGRAVGVDARLAHDGMSLTLASRPRPRRPT